MAQRTRRLSVHWHSLSLADRGRELQLAVYLSLRLFSGWRENCNLKKRVSLLLGWDRMQDSCSTRASGMGRRPLLSWWLLRYVSYFLTLSCVWSYLNLIYFSFCETWNVWMTEYNFGGKSRAGRQSSSKSYLSPCLLIVLFNPYRL